MPYGTHHNSKIPDTYVENLCECYLSPAIETIIHNSHALLATLLFPRMQLFTCVRI